MREPGRLRGDSTAHDPRVDLLLVYAVHDALRRDLRRLVAWSRTCVPVTTPAWVDFRRHLATYLDADGGVLWPFLRGRGLPGPDPVRTAGVMERKRRRLGLLVQTVDDCLSGRGPASRTAEHMAGLDAAVTEYLDYEQAVVVPILARCITRHEWADFDAAQRHPLGLTSGVALCTWLVDGSPPDRQEAIRELFPPAVRLAHRWLGARRVRRPPA